MTPQGFVIPYALSSDEGMELTWKAGVPAASAGGGDVHNARYPQCIPRSKKMRVVNVKKFLSTELRGSPRRRDGWREVGCRV